MHKLSLILGLSAAAFSLNACKSVMDPTFIPSGYAHHQKEFKAPPADDPWSIGYDYTRDANAAVLNEWKAVAADLSNKIESTAPLSAAPIFLSSPAMDNAFTLSLDHALRQEFLSRGYTLATIPREDTIKLQISSYDPEFQDVMRSYNLNDQDQIDRPEPSKAVNKDLILKVDGLVNDIPTTLVEAPYKLPLYGYQDEQLYFPLGQNIAEVWR